MSDDDNNVEHEARSGGDFWGSTPDWPSSPRGGRSDRLERRPDITGAIKNLWGAAMGAGADATREHRIIDASAVPVDDTSPIDATMFDDLDDDTYSVTEAGPVDEPIALHATTEIPVTRARRRESGTAFDAASATAASVSVEDGDVSSGDDADRAAMAFSPVAATGQARMIDPLLARVGGIAVVVALGVSLVVGITSGDDADDSIASGDTTTPTLQLEAAPTVAPSTVAVATADADAPITLDPATLPPAVPVNPEPEPEPEAASTTAAPESTVAVELKADSADAAQTDSTTTATETTADAESTSATSDATTDVPAVDAAAEADDQAERVKNCAIDYEVQAGDYWLLLADGADVPLAELLEANGATVNTALFPGASICLPAGASTPPASTATTVPVTTTAPTTTVTPTTTTAPTTTVASTPAGPEDVQQIIRDVWPDELEERALEIAYRESRYVPTAKNFCCYGIFQIYWTVHSSWLDDIGITSADQLYDPATNARAAYALYQRAGGWGPWAL